MEINYNKRYWWIVLIVVPIVVSIITIVPSTLNKAHLKHHNPERYIDIIELGYVSRWINFSKEAFKKTGYNKEFKIPSRKHKKTKQIVVKRLDLDIKEKWASNISYIRGELNNKIEREFFDVGITLSNIGIQGSLLNGLILRNKLNRKPDTSIHNIRNLKQKYKLTLSNLTSSLIELQLIRKYFLEEKDINVDDLSNYNQAKSVVSLFTRDLNNIKARIYGATRFVYSKSDFRQK